MSINLWAVLKLKSNQQHVHLELKGTESGRRNIMSHWAWDRTEQNRIYSRIQSWPVNICEWRSSESRVLPRCECASLLLLWVHSAPKTRPTSCSVTAPAHCSQPIYPACTANRPGVEGCSGSKESLNPAESQQHVAQCLDKISFNWSN